MARNGPRWLGLRLALDGSPTVHPDAKHPRVADHARLAALQSRATTRQRSARRVMLEHDCVLRFRPPAHLPFSKIESWYADRKSTRLNSSHVKISYAVFC